MLARIELYMEAKNWEPLVAVAMAVARADPDQERAWIGWAYGLRCLERVAEARTVLLEAEVHHGKTSALLHYNLACYECLLGDLTAAMGRLRRARKLGGKQFKAMALDDDDLRAMRDEIAAMGQI
jgi:Flp pilus assembly protein TadD